MDSSQSSQDEDINIEVSLTAPEEFYCIEIWIAGKKILLHTRSAVDLSRKLNLAILDWIGQQSASYLRSLIEE